MSSGHVTVVGKFIHLAGQRHLVRGVSYGTFVPDAEGFQFPAPETIRRDFTSMRRAHINTVRIYTSPTPHLLDEAARCNLSVIVGVPWPQHLAFLDDRRMCREIRRSVRSIVQQFAGHPASLLFALGNEIPAEVVRWCGARRVERFLRDLYDEAKAAAPDSLFAYVNYPPTEYVDTSCFDVAAFNVYLHRESALRPYFAHLQHIAGEKPLLLTEAGADRFREGEDQQAALTSMQLRVAFAEGAAGAVAFTWTDEWWRGGHVVDDWAFGLVDVGRHPKPALHATSRVFASAPFSAADRRDWPRVSVVVCAYNAADTISECLTSLEQLTYPDFEVIVVNDGSRDGTAEIARHHAVRLIDVENGGLSTARNIGLAHATGDVVAYTDADVRVDPDWLTYLVQPLLDPSMVGAGGPNVPPSEDPWLAQCVALAPGGPAHVLLDDRTAEHVPGCNMAFRRDALLSIGGFDPRYHAAGDDVDVCWRLQANGLRIGFAPSALVWHHRRPTVRAYWRQQVGYGEAEGWLMRHHPDKFLDGRALWRGRIYGSLPFTRSLFGTRVNAGVWGTASFPSVYSTHSRPLSLLPHLIEWQALSVMLMALGALLVPSPEPAAGKWFLSVGGLGVALTVGQCLGWSWRTSLDGLPAVGSLPSFLGRLFYRLTIAGLHVLQPVARFWGQLRGSLRPSRTLAGDRLTHHGHQRRRWTGSDLRHVVSATGLLLSRRKAAYWSERWINRPDLLTRLVGALRAAGVGPSIEVDDGWQPARDVSVSAGRWAWLDLRTLVEDHGSGKVLVRLASRVRLTPIGLAAAAFWLLVLVGSANGSKFMAGLIPVLSVLIALWLLRRLGRTEAAIRECVERTVLELGATPLLEKPASRRRRIDQPSHPASSRSLIPSPLTGPLNVVVLDEPVMLAHPRASAPMARLSHENEPNPPPVNPRPGMVA